jgi:hypothetical protein
MQLSQVQPGPVGAGAERGDRVSFKTVATTVLKRIGVMFASGSATLS